MSSDVIWLKRIKPIPVKINPPNISLRGPQRSMSIPTTGASRPASRPRIEEARETCA